MFEYSNEVIPVIRRGAYWWSEVRPVVYDDG
jgi:hypothetical protein